MLKEVDKPLIKTSEKNEVSILITGGRNIVNWKGRISQGDVLIKEENQQK